VATSTTRRREGEPRTLRQIIHHQSGGREQVKLLDPNGGLVVRKVSDGHDQWEHFITRGWLIRRPLPDPQQRRERDLASLEILARNFSVLLEGTEVVAGRQAYRIGIARREGGAAPSRRLWIDQNSYIELKSARYTDDGQVTTVMALDRVNLAPNLRPEIFRFKPPPNLEPRVAPAPAFSGDLEEAQRRVGFPALLPPWTPPGFELLTGSVSVHHHKGTPMLALRYTDGLDSFSIFQRKAIPEPKPPGRPASKQHGTVRTWEKDGYHFTVVGRIEPQHVELIRAAYR
jgi:negative regulator of sigma E activity